MVLFFGKQVYKNIFKGILGLTALSMLAGAGFTLFSKKSLKNSSSFATIDGEAIEYRDLTRREQAKREQLALMKYQFEQMGLPFEQSMFDVDPKKLAFSGLFEEILLNRVVKSLGLCLDEEYVASKFSDQQYVMRELSEFFPAYLAMAQDFDADHLARALARQGMTIADFESYMERDLERKLVKNLTINTLYNPGFMLRKKYAQEYASKKFSVAKFSQESFLKEAQKQTFSDAEMTAFFNERKNHYRIPEKRSGLLWEFSPEKYGIEITDAMIKDHYEKNKNEFVASPVKLKVRKILFKIHSQKDLSMVSVRAQAVLAELKKNPALFIEMVKQHSEDVNTAKKDGLVDFFARGEMDPNFEKAAFGLKEDGEVSSVVQTGNGLEIIQRVERRAPEYKKLVAVSSELRTALLAQRFKQRFELDIEKLAQADYGQLESFAKEKQARQSAVKMLENDGSPMAEHLFRREGFSSYQSQNKGFLVRLTDVHQSYIPEFAQVKTQIAHDMAGLKAREGQFVALKEAKDKLGSASLQHIADTYKGKLVTIDWLKQDDADRIKNLTSDGLPVAQMLQMEKVGTALAYHNGVDGYLIKLEALSPFKEQDFMAKRLEIEQELLRGNSYVALNSFVASLARDAKLETREKSLEIDSFDAEESNQINN